MPAMRARVERLSSEAFPRRISAWWYRRGTDQYHVDFAKKTIAGIAQETAWSFARRPIIRTQGAIDRVGTTARSKQSPSALSKSPMISVAWIGPGRPGELRFQRPSRFLHHPGKLIP